MTDKITKGVIVSDMHCGSIYGLLPPGFMSGAGAEIKQNSMQEYLWECWVDFGKWVKTKFGPVDFLIINGEPIDGRQEAQKATEACLTLLNDQGAAAKTCLETLFYHTKPKKVFGTKGSEYHDQKAGEAADGIYEAIGATPYRGLGTGRVSREVMDLEIDGVILNVAHHISIASGFYLATPLDREGIFSALAGKEAKMPKADLCVRSHAHKFVHVEHESKHIVVTPCWQLQTSFMRRHSVYRMLPSIGGIVVLVDPEAKKQKDDPIEIKKRVYDLPKIGTTKL